MKQRLLCVHNSSQEWKIDPVQFKRSSCFKQWMFCKLVCFPWTFLPFMPGFPGVKKFLSITGAARKHTFWCRRPRFSVRMSMTRGVLEKLGCRKDVCTDILATIKIPRLVVDGRAPARNRWFVRACPSPSQRTKIWPTLRKGFLRGQMDAARLSFSWWHLCRTKLTQKFFNRFSNTKIEMPPKKVRASSAMALSKKYADYFHSHFTHNLTTRFGHKENLQVPPRLDDPIRANQFADSCASLEGSRYEPLFCEARFGALQIQIANRRFQAIRVNRSNVMKIGVSLRTDSRCEWPGHLSCHANAFVRVGFWQNGFLSTSDFQSEVGEVFGEIGGELPAKFGRRFSSFFCWGKLSEAFSTKTPPQISPSNFTTRFWVVAGPRFFAEFYF